jgi:hypothetical protein
MINELIIILYFSILLHMLYSCLKYTVSLCNHAIIITSFTLTHSIDESSTRLHMQQDRK